MNIGEMFCDDIFSVLIDHARVCSRCRKGALRILKEFPLLTMAIPAKTKQTLIESLEHLERQGKP
jgi:hypothetical protein